MFIKVKEEQSSHGDHGHSHKIRRFQGSASSLLNVRSARCTDINIHSLSSFFPPLLPSPPCPIRSLPPPDPPFSPLLPETLPARPHPVPLPLSSPPEETVQPRYPLAFRQKWQPYAPFPSQSAPVSTFSFRWQSGCHSHQISTVLPPHSSASASVHPPLRCEHPRVDCSVLLQSSLPEWLLAVTSRYSN